MFSGGGPLFLYAGGCAFFVNKMCTKKYFYRVYALTHVGFMSIIISMHQKYQKFCLKHKNN